MWHKIAVDNYNKISAGYNSNKISVGDNKF